MGEENPDMKSTMDKTSEIVEKCMIQAREERGFQFEPTPESRRRQKVSYQKPQQISSVSAAKTQSTSGSPVANDEARQNVRDSSAPEDDGRKIMLVEGRKNSVNRVDEFTRIMHNYKIINVMSPFEFYVIREEDVEPYERMLMALEEMQDHFDAEESKGHKYAVTKPEIHGTYGIWCEGTSKWHRVRLVDYDVKAELACVFNFDECFQEFFPLKSLRTLALEYANAPYVPMYRAHLYDVIPVDESLFWSIEATDWFTEMVKDKSLWWKGLQMSWHKRDLQTVSRKDKRTVADPIIDVGMVLFEDGKLTNIKDSLNWRMVKVGFGKSIGIGATSSTMLYVNNMIPSYLLDGNSETVENHPDCLDTIDIFAAYRICQVVPVYIKSPLCIYVHILNKVVDLNAMERSLKNAIAELPKIGKEQEIQVGDSVIFSGSDMQTGKNKCYRAVVLAVENDNVEIILVDYGNIMKLERTSLCIMPEFYATIPSYAHRIHLKTIRPLIPESKKLSRRSSNEFNRLMESVQNMKPAFFVFRSDAKDFKDVVELHKIHQDVAFELDQEKWKAEPFKNLEKFDLESYSKMKNDNMLASHFVSFGAEILYMKKTFEDVMWEVNSVTDEIVQDEGRFEMKLVRKKEEFDKVEYYRKLLEYREKYWIWDTKK